MVRLRFIFLLATFVHICANGIEMIKAPIAKKEISTFHEHGKERVDQYYWLNKRDNPEVLAYVKAENDYTTSKMESTLALQKKLEAEFKKRIKENDTTVPYRKGNYYYYTRYEENKADPIYCRKKDSLENPEEIILDVNKLAKGYDYYTVETIKISPNENLLAYAEDSQGRRKYKIRIKDLTTGQLLKDTLIDTASDLEWANDSQTLFYSLPEPVTLRSNRVYQHKLGTQVSKDKLVYEEKDDTYYCEVTKTKSRQYLLIGSFKKDTSEFQIVDANQPDNAFTVFSPRIEGQEYYVDHLHDQFIIRTNEDAPNFKLMQCALDKTAKKHWQPFLPYNPEIYLNDVEVFDDFIVLEERQKGLDHIKIHPLNRDASFYIEFDEPDYDAAVVFTPEMSSKEVRFKYSSLKTPESIYEFNTQTKHKVLKKQDEILGDFHSENYEVQRVYAKAKDGTQIPISLVCRKDKFKAHHNPLLIAGYGSYGLSYESDFDPYVISLLDRGFVFAIAHVRGGSELGRQWYYQGKLLNKKNTFTDFIDATEHLVKQGYGASNNLFAMGGSAGGLLMGAVINMQPQLFKGVIAQVPFVDLINTMMDPNIPLTTSEYAEWGHPDDKTYYDYMLSYSPYDNIQPKAYPNLLVTASYHDSQVQYWDAAKWVAHSRATTKGDNLLLLKTTMNAGHSGGSGRYEHYKEKAFEYAFLLSLEG